MSDGKPALFVQQRTYRRRRLADAARMLPILGGILFMIPLLWLGSASMSTATVMVYLFVIWAALVGIAAVLSRRLGPEEDQPEDRNADHTAMDEGAG
ncbi:MAG: hypothetical protein AAF280_14455 [Pseudomonadota bacterium]